MRDFTIRVDIDAPPATVWAVLRDGERSPEWTSTVGYAQPGRDGHRGAWLAHEGGGDMKLDIYLNYRGNCEEAFQFYEQHLGGTITGVVRHGSIPNPNIPSDWGEKIMHARVEIGTTVLMGADIPHSEPMRSAYLALSLETEDEAERVYGLLADGGQIFMTMEKTHFANRFAMLRDRFGTSWMLLHQPEE